MFPKHLASDSNITSPVGEQTQTCCGMEVEEEVIL